MMKTKLHYLLMALFGLALFACESESELVQPDLDGVALEIDDQSGELCGEGETYPLRLDEFTSLGTVDVSNDDMYLYVTVNADEGFNPTADPNLFLYVGTNLGDITLNSLEYPVLEAANFDYTATATEMTYTFNVPLADIAGYNQECGVQELIVFVGAKAITGGAYFNGTAGEMMYEGNPSVPWFYDMYTPQCCEDGEETCETAFAKFDVRDEGLMGYVFTDKEKDNPEGYAMLGIATRWGWAGKFSADGSYEFDIWTAAGRNDTNKGAWVGTLYVDIYEGDVDVCYDLMDGYDMKEVHIYADDEAPTTAAPGQYTYVMEFDEDQTEHCKSFEVEGDYVWLIAHAVVCGEYDLEEEEEEEEED